MKTKKLKKGIIYNTIEKNYIKSVMYEFDFSEEILFVEEQKDGTSDHAILHYTVDVGEKAYFSEEFIPVGVSKKGMKKPDITAIIENSANKKIKWFIYDIKDTVINASTVLKLCNQWHSGIYNISKEYLQHMSDYEIQDSVGVITRFRDKDLLKKEIEKCEEKINGKNQLMTARKSLTKIIDYKEMIRATNNIINECFEDYEERNGNTKIYKINFVELQTTDNMTYTAHMQIRL